MAKRTANRPRPPPVQEDLFTTNDETAILKMELQGAKDRFKILQDQFDDMRRAYLEIRQQNEALRKELGH